MCEGDDTQVQRLELLAEHAIEQRQQLADWMKRAAVSLLDDALRAYQEREPVRAAALAGEGQAAAELCIVLMRTA